MITRKMVSILITTLLLIMLVAACSGNNLNNTPSQDDAVSLPSPAEDSVDGVKDLGIVKVITMGDKPQIDMEEVYYPMLDEMTAQWGIKIRAEWIPWGQELTTLQTRIAAGDIDLITTGPWANYTTLAEANAFYDLNKVIDQAPKLIEKFGGRKALSNLEINGKLNYIPQFSGNSANGFIYRADLAEQWGLEPVTNVETMNAFLYKGKEVYNRPMIVGPTAELANNNLPLFANVIQPDTGAPAVMVDLSNPFEAFFMYDMPEYLQALKLAKQWYDDGITNPDFLNSQENEGNMFQDDLLPSVVMNHFAAAKVNIIPQAVSKLNGGEADADASNPRGIKIGFYPYMMDDAKILPQNMGNTTGVAIGVNTSDEKAAAIIKFIEAVHTDKAFFDKFQYGIEGVTYESFPTDTTVSFGTIPNEKRVYRKISTGFTNADMVRTEQIRYKDLAEDLDKIEEMIDSRTADVNPLNGFIFNPEKVQNQILAVNDVLARTKAIRAGITGNKSAEEALEEMVKMLKAAGVQAIVEEMNVQLQEFKARTGQ